MRFGGRKLLLLGSVMNYKNMLLSFLPWVVFSVLVQRIGAHVAGIACLAAAGLALLFAYQQSKNSSVKLIDITGIAVFGVMAVVAFSGGDTAEQRIADYGRGISSLVLGLIMLGSTLVVPFTEQYARESVAQEHWTSPVFRAVNRKISFVWGVVVTLMAGGHLLAGRLDPPSDPSSGTRPVDLPYNDNLYLQPGRARPAHARRARLRAHLRRRDRHRHPGTELGRLRRGFRAGQHRPTDRWRGRDRVPQHSGQSLRD